MERKEHYRLHKSGKRWVAGIVATAAVGVPLAFQTPVAQAAVDTVATAAPVAKTVATDKNGASQTTNTEATEFTFAEQKNALLAYLKDKGQLTLPADVFSKPNGDTVEKVINGADTWSDLQYNWQDIATSIAMDEARQKLGLSGKVSDSSNRNALEAFNGDTSQVAGHTKEKNSGVILNFASGFMFADSTQSDVVATINKVTAYVDLAVNKQLPWQASRIAILRAVDDGQWGDLDPRSAAGTFIPFNTLDFYLSDVDGPTELTNAWKDTAYTIARREAGQQLGDTSTDAIDAFLAKASPVNGYSGKTNKEAIAEVTAQTPAMNGQSESAPDFTQGIKKVTDYVDSAVNGTDTGYIEKAATGTIYVKNTNGANVYTDVNLTKQDGSRTIAYRTAEDFTAKVYDAKNNVVGYKIGSNQYIKAGDVQDTALTGITTQDFTGSVKVVTSPTQVYSDTALTKAISGQTLAKDTTWDVSQKVFFDGKLAGYKIANGKYVKAGDVDIVTENGISVQDYPGTIQITAKAAQVYSDNQLTKAITGQTLVAGTTWQVGQKVFRDGTLIGYNLGGNQFVKAADAKDITDTGITTQNVRGVATITATTQVYSNTAMTNPISGKTLATGTRWQVYQKVFSNGVLVGYNLGGSQYVKVGNVQFAAENQNISTQTFSGTVSVINPRTPVYSDSALTNTLGWTMDAGTRWQTFQKVFNNGQLIGYNVGGSQYVRASDVQVVDSSEDNFTVVPENGVVAINSRGGAYIYSDPAMTQMIPNRWLTNGAQYKTFAKVYRNGQLVGYNLGGKQFIRVADIVTVQQLYGNQGTFTVHYYLNPTWGIAVVNSQMQVQRIIPAGTHWRAYGYRQLSDGRTYYNLGGDQWVPTDYGWLD